MVFEIASTNLVVELGILLALLMGWQFTAAEFVGGPIMIVLLAVLYRIFLRKRLVADALRQADKGVAGSMEGHAAMDMSITGQRSFWGRLTSARGYTAVSHIFVMEWAAIWRDIAVWLLITGALAARGPGSRWAAPRKSSSRTSRGITPPGSTSRSWPWPGPCWCASSPAAGCRCCA